MSDQLQSETELENARNIALKKLGQSIFNFGLVEQWLKYLVTVSDVTTTGAVIDSKTAKRINKTQQMMLGQLIGDILEKWHPDNLSKVNQIQDLFDIRIAFSFGIEMSLDDYHMVKGSLEAMVGDRNYLVHQFSKNYTLSTVENCHAANIYLDDLREKHLASMRHLQEVVKTYLELLKELQQEFSE